MNLCELQSTWRRVQIHLANAIVSNRTCIIMYFEEQNLTHRMAYKQDSSEQQVQTVVHQQLSIFQSGNVYPPADEKLWLTMIGHHSLTGTHSTHRGQCPERSLIFLFRAYCTPYVYNYKMNVHSLLRYYDAVNCDE